MEKWIKDPRTLGADAVEQLPELISRYPYCATYRLLYLIALANVHSTRLKDEVRRHAPAIPDRLKLFKSINRGEYGWIALMHQLEQRRRQQPDANDFELIDNFLQAEADGQLFVPNVESENLKDDDSDDHEKIKDRAFLSQSLAKVYVKQGKYEQALAIFLDLNLKFSKKNTYFADQIRYLEKVIELKKSIKN